MAALPPGVPGNWALYDENDEAAVPFDTFFACTVKQENKIAQNPVERGGFVDYNKSGSPVNLGVILARSGSSAELSAMLEALDKLVAGTGLVSIVTPEKTFLDFNLAAYDYDRKTENGADRLLVSLSMEEIRQVEAEYGNEQIPPVKTPEKAADKSSRQAGKQAPQKADAATTERTWKKYDSQLARRM